MRITICCFNDAYQHSCTLFLNLSLPPPTTDLPSHGVLVVVHVVLVVHAGHLDVVLPHGGEDLLVVGGAEVEGEEVHAWHRDDKHARSGGGMEIEWHVSYISCFNPLLLSSEQSWAISVFLHFFNNKK